VTEISQLIGRYVACWNEPDPAARRKVIDETWSPAGVYRNASTEYEGRDGIEQAVTEAYDAFSSNGFAFEVASIQINHDAIRYQWLMVPRAGDEPDSIGTHVAVVDGDGRLVSDYQFIDTAPSSA
jgi:hypothetical protein